jgi:hypothetical protein
MTVSARPSSSSSPVSPCTGSKTERSPKSGTPATPSGSCTSSTPTSGATTTTTDPNNQSPGCTASVALERPAIQEAPMTLRPLLMTTTYI